MTKMNLNNAVPFEATHVGEVIKDELAARDMKQSELAELTGIQKPILNDIIKGKRALTPEMALLLEKALDVPAQFLMNVQTNYELDCARISERVVEQTKMMEVWKIIKDYICVPFFKKVDVIRGNVIEDVKRLFEVFDVTNLDEFFGLKAMEMELAYYKKSEKLATDPKDIFSWKYYCYSLSKKQKIEQPFEPERITELTKELNQVFLENNDTISKVKETMNRYGIKFLVVNKVGQVPVDGMSFWMGDNPTIVVTERIASIDNLAFTTLHEVGHTALHLEKDGKAMINIEDEKKDEKETEADNFARNATISDADWRRFMMRTRNVGPFKIAPYIEREATERGVHPQILFGRYKHDVGVYQIRRAFDNKIH